MKIGKILNSKFSLLVTGFVLTGLIGSFLSYQFQNISWKRQARFEITKRQIEQTESSIDETLLIARKRFYAMQKVFWALEKLKSDIADQRWNEYYKIKDEWNIMVGGYRSKIKIFVDPALAYELLDKDNARNYSKKESLHAIFVTTHYKLKQLFEYTGKNPEERFEIEKEALNALSELGDNLSNFSDGCYKSYLKKYDLLKDVCN